MKLYNSLIIFILIFLNCSKFEVLSLPNLQNSSIGNTNIFSALPLNGNAEIAQYRGKVKRYNQFRDAHLALITVYEPFDYTKLVKNDNSSNYVLKQNQVLSFQTGVYPYRQMNSLFWNPHNLQLIKAVMTSQEWCGQSYKQISYNKNQIRLHFHTYWEKEADGEYYYDIPKLEYYFYDELPLILRFIDNTDTFKEKNIEIFPLLMSSKVNNANWDIYSSDKMPKFESSILKKEYTFFNYKNKKIEVLKYTLESKYKKDYYYIDYKHPNHILIRWERHDGGYFELDHLSYAKYWELHNEKDKLPENVYRYN